MLLRFIIVRVCVCVRVRDCVYLIDLTTVLSLSLSLDALVYCIVLYTY